MNNSKHDDWKSRPVVCHETQINLSSSHILQRAVQMEKERKEQQKRMIIQKLTNAQTTRYM